MKAACLILPVLASFICSGCISTTINDAEFSSLQVVDWRDRPELPDPCNSDCLLWNLNPELAQQRGIKKPISEKWPRQLLKIEFTTRVNLSKYIHGWYNLGTSAHFCDRPYVRGLQAPAAWPYVYYEGNSVWGGDSEPLFQHSVNPGQIFTYYIFIDVALKAAATSIPPQESYDLRESPTDICFRIGGGNEAGFGFRSNTVVVPKDAISAVINAEHSQTYR